MKKSTLALTVMALLGSGAVVAAPAGGTSNSSGVDVGASNHFMFGGGNSGLKLNGSAMGYIDIAGGPVNGSNAAISARDDGTIMTPSDLGLFGSSKIAQVWNDTASVSGGSDTANVAINSVRQITPPFFAPQFGGLVIGQVGATSSGSPADPVVPLSVGSGVYFGEWAPAVASPVDDSTDLNMSSANRTVWYVGDNAVTSTPNMVNAQYNVVGIRQTGEGTNLPTAHELYTGTLTANYGPGTNTLTGSIDRGLETVSFDSVAINSTGGFTGSGSDAVGTGSIDGHFYNGAHELAGIYTTTNASDGVAFGGSHNGSGTITP
tara:strand:+ start:11429 stop:12388 length:960 start_codon:yes stop_codon:yes gene_type:complete